MAGAEPERQLPLTPIGSSWINRIEIWFGIITRQAIRRGTFASVAGLIKRRGTYGWPRAWQPPVLSGKGQRRGAERMRTASDSVIASRGALSRARSAICRGLRPMSQ
jgi:hypothetical protein